MAEHLTSANDFIDVAKYLNTLRKETQSQYIPNTKAIRSDVTDFTVETHPMSTYTEILGGAASWTYRELVQEIVCCELRKREEKSIQKRLRWAKFPYHKTLMEFDLSDQTSLSKRHLSQLQELNWLEQQYNLNFLGPSGVGKTHLSIALGMEAIQKGFQVTFVTMGELLSLLKPKNLREKHKSN